MARVDEFDLPDELYYDRKDHLWAGLEGGTVRVGLDRFGQKMAGTVAYLKLLPAGRAVQKGRSFGSLEAGKYIGPLRAPVSGRLAEVNGAVLANPGLLNADPYGEGWLVVVEPANLAADLADLAHGPAVQPWLEDEVQDYRARGLIQGQP
jgi:glycine cleavage system H protein